MSVGSTHYFPRDRVHFTWDVSNPPALTVDTGDVVVLHTREVVDNQITPDSDSGVFDKFDWDRVYPLAGPIAVRDAEPGDTLAVEIIDIRTEGWGWSAILPGSGLLPEDFHEPYLKIFDLTGGDVTYLREDIAIPIEPMLGTMGVCPLGASSQPVERPGIFGGNLDTRQLTRGTTLFLPVQVPGALFSCGDAHAAQGDGEVCVTGIEAPTFVVMRFTLQRGRWIPAPQFTGRGGLSRRVDRAGFYATTGVTTDLMSAAQDSIRAMIDHLGEAYGLSREDAYVLCSLCVDLRISEIVDDGVFVVSAFLPLAVFDPALLMSDRGIEIRS